MSYRNDPQDDISRGLRNGEHLARRGLGRIADTAADLSDRAGDYARQGADWVREGGSRMRDQVARAQDRTTDYVRAEPMRALLMAAATGAILFAVVRMLGRRMGDDRVGERMGRDGR